MKKRHLRPQIRKALETIRNTVAILIGLYFWALSILFVVGFRL